MSKSNPEIWRNGTSYAEGFVNPQSELMFICKKTEYMKQPVYIIFSVEELAEIIVAVNKRKRLARQTPPPCGDDFPF